MAILLLLFPALLSAIVCLSEITPVVPHFDSQSGCTDHNNLACELQEMKLKITRLETILDESIKNLNAKSHHLEEQEKLIEEMAHKIHFLQTVLINIKRDSSYAEGRLNALEDEVRLLWAASRKNNFNLHNLESKARDAEERLEVVTSRVEKVENIVTEQWIQVRNLEQALQITEISTLEAQKKAWFTRCTFLKFINSIFGCLQKIIEVLESYLFAKDTILSSYMSQAPHQFKRIMSAAKKYHHELQGFVKQEMEKNEFTAALANQEMIFFVASALITFPVMIVGMWLSSCFS